MNRTVSEQKAAGAKKNWVTDSGLSEQQSRMFAHRVNCRYERTQQQNEYADVGF